ncbi:MAG TPA: OmpH family outer membrane protein [Blastocatellia bacterium]|nr:OmpH family outer membrane protein [Blastocatellia bacterium]
MQKIKLAAVALMAMAAMAVSASAQQPAQPSAPAAVPDGKIAVVNTNAFPPQISELKQKYDQVENQLRDRYQKLGATEQQLKQLESDIQTKCPSMAPDKCRELQLNYADTKKRWDRDVEDFKSDYERALEVATGPVKQKLIKFMETYAIQRGIVMIINLPGAAQTQSIAYWNPATDITDDFIAEYNKANPVAAAATPPPQPAAQKPAPVKPNNR